jgi:ubiquinone/menaquinone biosynthesis C-methylase UbiE
MKPSQLQVVEDRRWSARDQELVWRHEAALGLVTDEPVLDVAGGDGLVLSLLRERKGFTRLTLLDVSPVAVEKAQRKNLEARVADITKPFPFPDNTFGTACALDVLEHLYDPLPTLQEMARVARWVVLVVPNFHYWKDRVRMLIGQVPFQCKPKRGHVHWFNYTTLQELTTQGKLKVDAVIFAGCRRCGPVGDWLARWHPNLFAHSFAVRLKKS